MRAKNMRIFLYFFLEVEFGILLEIGWKRIDEKLVEPNDSKIIVELIFKADRVF